MEKFYTAILDFVIRIHVSCPPIKSFTEILVNLTLGSHFLLTFGSDICHQTKSRKGLLNRIYCLCHKLAYEHICHPLKHVYST